MPKRKRNQDDFENITRKIKKLEKKLSRARRDSSELQSSGASTPQSDHQPGASLEDIEEQGHIIENPPECSVTLENKENTNIQNLEETCECDELSKDILEILGEDPSKINEQGKEIHKDLANRLEHISISGLNRELRKELLLQYTCPSNATRLGAPLLNSEIKAALPEALVNRDKAIEARQKLLTSAISCLSSAISDMLTSKDQNKDLLKKLMDASRILCDIQYSDSITRRKYSCGTLKKEIKDQIQNTKIDKYLFGENLTETLKAAKAISKSGAEIKVPNSNNNNMKKQKTPMQKQGNLNWKAPPARRPPAPQRQQGSKEPVSRRNQHYRSSRTSTYHQKQTRRR